MQASERAINVHGISKWYGDFRAVHDVTFEVRRGEIFALLGPNGAGKSTTIRMILDILKPDAGRIEVLGAPLSDETKNQVGYLPEERGLYKGVRVLEMMSYLGQLKGMTGQQARQRAMQLLERLELAEHAQSKVQELSKGMQQKVQFAVTVMHDPQLIIVDEPFSGLDPVNRLVIKALLEDFRADGGAIVMSTHQMNQVEEMADRMLMISRGEQKLYGEVDSIRREYALHAIIVEGQGNWEALPGVARVEAARNQNGAILLHLNENVTPDQVLAAIAQSSDMRLERYELAIPSLDEVFIRVVGEHNGEANYA
jgi:ABC-2 type transport system ATP-binding protein